MTRTRTRALFGIITLLGLMGLWFFGGHVLGPGKPSLRATAGRGGETALAVDGLLEQLEIIPMAGRLAPPFTLDTLEGARFRLADHSGRPALLYFWATW